MWTQEVNLILFRRFQDSISDKLQQAFPFHGSSVERQLHIGRVTQTFVTPGQRMTGLMNHKEWIYSRPDDEAAFLLFKTHKWTLSACSMLEPRSLFPRTASMNATNWTSHGPPAILVTNFNFVIRIFIPLRYRNIPKLCSRQYYEML